MKKSALLEDEYFEPADNIDVLRALGHDIPTGVKNEGDGYRVTVTRIVTTNDCESARGGTCDVD